MLRMLILILVLMISIVPAQPADGCPGGSQPCDYADEAEKFDEFGKIDDAEFKTRLEKFISELNKNPSDQGYIINYGSDREVSRREKMIREGLAFRRYDASRITIVRGGKAVNPKTEFWRVPPGAEYPRPDYDNSKGTERTQTRTFAPQRLEEFGEVSDRFFKTIFKQFFERVDQNKTLKGYIVMRGTDDEVTALMDKVRGLVEFAEYDSERIIFLKKPKTQNQATIALWLVPEGAELPEN